MLPDWSNLPEHLLVQVLGFVQQSDRLRHCALVNAAWAAAARRATRHATCSLLGLQQDSLQDFLRHGDSGVQSVKLFGVGPAFYDPAQYPLLPVTVPLTGVTRLEVEGTKFPVPVQPGSAILLSGLRQLDLKHCNSHTSSLTAALQGSCSSLTSLLLGHRWGEDQEPNQLRNLLLPLTALAELALSHWRGEELPGLPITLTRLLLRRSPQFSRHSFDVSTLLQPLTSLQVLELHGASLKHHLPLTGLREVELDSVRLDLSVLSSTCSLQKLELLNCKSISGPHFTVSALQGISELQLLKMGGPSASGAITQLSSLSWLSVLTQLHLQCEISKQQWDVLAQDVVSRASGLQKLVLGDATNVGAVGAARLELDQLRQLVSSCSQLQHLSLYADVTSPAATTSLKHLPQTCRGLEIYGCQWCPTVLAQLTWLTDLTWKGDYNFSDVDLRQLTALHNLQALSLQYCYGISHELGKAVLGLGPGSYCDFSGEWGNDGFADVRGACLKFKTCDPQGSVCEQLQAVCKASPQCALADLPGLRDELVALRDELHASKDQVHALRERVEQLLFDPFAHVVVNEAAAAAAGGVDHMRQQFVVMAQAVEGLLSRGMYAALLDGLSGSQPTAEQFAEACTAVQEQNAHRLLRVLKAIVDGDE